MSTIKSSAENLTLNADGANNDIIFQSNGSTKATLDQAGLLTATTFSSSVSQNVSALFNRTSNDGGVVSLRKNGSEVGNLGCRDGFLTIYSGDTGLGFADDHIRGMTSTGSRDAAIDLGRAATRFKDLYLSGGLKIGGTGTANTLDDYEEGTFTPSFSGNIAFSTKQNFTYTKIGSLVHITGYLNGASGTFGTSWAVTGLPFGGNAAYNLAPLWSHGVDLMYMLYMTTSAAITIRDRDGASMNGTSELSLQFTYRTNS